MNQAIQALINQSIKASHICNEFYASLNGWTVYRRNGQVVEWSKLENGQWSEWSFYGGFIPDWAGIIRWELG